MSSADVDRALSLPPDQVGPALASLPEDQWFERKSARTAPRDVAIPLVAMANADGGVLVVGLHDGLVEDVPPSGAMSFGKLRWTSPSRRCGCALRRSQQLPRAATPSP